jgi:hypothetical protein
MLRTLRHLDLGVERLGLYWLDHVHIESSRARTLTVTRLPVARYGDDACAVASRIAAQRARHLEAAHPRHLDVEEHDVGDRVPDLREGARTVERDVDVMTAPLEQGGERLCRVDGSAASSSPARARAPSARR